MPGHRTPRGTRRKKMEIKYDSKGLPVGVSLESVFVAFGTLVKREVQRNCREKGGRHFWREVADATRVASVSDSGVTVVNEHVAAAQKQYGGPISAKNAKALTIPISSLARGKRAGEFPQRLFAIKGEDGRRILGYNKGRGKKRQFVPLYALVKRVNQKPEPFWPDEAKARELLEHAKSLAGAGGTA